MAVIAMNAEGLQEEPDSLNHTFLVFKYIIPYMLWQV